MQVPVSPEDIERVRGYVARTLLQAAKDQKVGREDLRVIARDVLAQTSSVTTLAEFQKVLQSLSEKYPILGNAYVQNMQHDETLKTDIVAQISKLMKNGQLEEAAKLAREYNA